MKKQILFIIALIIIRLTYSQTTIPAGSVSGVWSTTGSPYLITGDISVEADSVLTIQPRVIVQFQGHFKLNVQGTLLAQGALGDSIIFTINSTTGFNVDSIPNGGWGGIRFENNTSSDSSKIDYCKIQYGKVMYPDSCGGGIFVKDFSMLVISNSNISNNRIFGGKQKDSCANLYGGGIACINSSPLIMNNLIAYNLINSGGYPVGPDGNYYDFNFSDVWGGGIYCFNSSSVIKNNIISLNSIIAKPVWYTAICYFADEGSAYGGGLALVNSTLTDIEGNYIIQNQGLSYFDVQGGGIYSINSNSDINNNIIESNAGNYGGCGFTYYLNGGGINCKNSKSDITNNIIEGNSATAGGGIYISDNSNVLISNNIIKYNGTKGLYENATALGGGIYLINSTADINYDTISSNSANGIAGDDVFGSAIGGGVYIETSACKISFNNVSSNVLSTEAEFGYSACGNGLGAGIYINGDSGFIINNNIINYNFINNSHPDALDYGAGLYLVGYGTNILTNAKIINNYIENNIINGSDNTNGGAGLCVGDFVLIANNVISNNSINAVGFGAGINCGYNNRLINNSICGNKIIGGYAWNYEVGVGVYCGDTTNVILNNIIWGIDNTNTEWGKDTVLTLINSGKLSYCDVQDTIIGLGNMFSNPLFDTSGTNPFSLFWNSPCIDKGNPDTTGLFLPQFDIAGNPRIINGRVDMGAYEFQGTVGINKEKPISITSIKVYPVPSTDYVCVDLTNFSKENVNLELFDIIGKKLKTFSNLSGYIVKLELNDIAKGLYILRATDRNNITATQKIIIE